MKFMLDTNAASAVMRKHPRMVAKVLLYGVHQIGLSAVSRYELRNGAESAKPESRERLLAQIDALPFEVLAFAADAADCAGTGQGRLLVAGAGIDDMDALIAGHAEATGLVLITRNIRHFSRWPGLIVMNWEE